MGEPFLVGKLSVQHPKRMLESFRGLALEPCLDKTGVLQVIPTGKRKKPKDSRKKNTGKLHSVGITHMFFSCFPACFSSNQKWFQRPQPLGGKGFVVFLRPRQETFSKISSIFASRLAKERSRAKLKRCFCLFWFCAFFVFW